MGVAYGEPPWANVVAADEGGEVVGARVDRVSGEIHPGLAGAVAVPAAAVLVADPAFVVAVPRLALEVVPRGPAAGVDEMGVGGAMVCPGPDDAAASTTAAARAAVHRRDSTTKSP